MIISYVECKFSMSGHCRQKTTSKFLSDIDSHVRLGPKTPPEIRAAGAAAFRNSSKLQLLQEQWTQCSGIWSQSDFYIQLKSKRRNRKFGCRLWLTRAEMIIKLGSAEIADQIIEAKESLEESARQEQVRANPNLHGKDTKDRLPFVDSIEYLAQKT